MTSDIIQKNIMLGQAFNLANERMKLDEEWDWGRFKALARKYYYEMKALRVEMNLR